MSSPIELSDSESEIKKKNKRTVSSSSDDDFEQILTSIAKENDSDSSFDVTRLDSTVIQASIDPPQRHDDSTNSSILTKNDKNISAKKKAKTTPKLTVRRSNISDDFSSEEDTNDPVDSSSPVITEKTAIKSKVLEKSSESFTTDSEDQYIMARPVVAKKSNEKTAVKKQTKNAKVPPKKSIELSSDDSADELDIQEINIPKQKRATKVDSQIDMTVRKPEPVVSNILPKKPDTRNLPKDVFGRPFKQPSFHSRQTRAEFEAQLKAEMPTRDGTLVDNIIFNSVWQAELSYLKNPSLNLIEETML